MKKSLALLLALCMTLTLAACGGAAPQTAPEPDNAPDEDPVSVAASDGALAVCLASEPDTIDPALNSSVDGATLIIHLFSGLAKWAQTDDGSLTIAADAAEELTEGVTNDDGTVTYTYTLRDGLKWSDGEPVTAADFVYSWNRAASVALGADYGYMFEVVKGYPNDLVVEATDDKTLVVTLNNDVSYWNELLAFPSFLPVREDVVANEAWATDPATYISNGAYTMTKWDHNSVITLTKNDNYFLADTIKMDEINFYLSDDENNMLANYQNGDWVMIDGVPNAEIDALKAQYPNEFVVGSQMGTYYVSWNVNANILPEGCELT
ncbi:MAG: peptide ABC transporter substrate-binding protein, partial [Oscillibacter sp.]|nr:peptide ABC transporter substrate-binding protein [Oscillibacter sp.]